MLDIKLIREKPDFVRENIKKRQHPEYLKYLNELIESDKKWREELEELNVLRAERNKISLEIAKIKKEKKDASKLLKQAAEIPGKIKEIEEETKKLEEKNRLLLLKIPNIIHDKVPIGKDETENVEIMRWGKTPKFNFEPKNHLEILQGLGMVDEERAAKVSGHGFFYFKKDLVLLDFAIQKFALDFLKKRGFTIIEPPFMIKRKPYEGVVDLTDFESVMYKIENEDLYLIATSEHSVGAMMMDEVIDKKDLPIRFAGISPCFRKEVGTHGKYTKGLFRMHQFNKIEQFAFCQPEQSEKMLEEIQKNAEDLYKELGLHYRVIELCSGDLSILKNRSYDTEVWMADGNFREVGSATNCTDYQARRLNVKFREGEGKAPAGFVHTLNNTALATSRTMLAIIEQFQQKDGSVKIPKVLVPYTGFDVLSKSK
ncbi:MAG: serine--tRNA ligase [Candidatus Aenigmatarchaeota archaeon]